MNDIQPLLPIGAKREQPLNKQLIRTVCPVRDEINPDPDELFCPEGFKVSRFAPIRTNGDNFFFGT